MFHPGHLADDLRKGASDNTVVYVTYGLTMRDAKMPIPEFVRLLESMNGKVALYKKVNGALQRASSEEYENPIPGTYYTLLDQRFDG